MPSYGRSHHRKRTQREYEKEITDAVKRFKKYPERMKYAGDSDEWVEFLKDIGVHDENAESEFFENVRLATLKNAEIQRQQRREMREIPKEQRPKMISSFVRATPKANVYLDTTKAGTQYREVYTTKGTGFRVVYRDPKTGHFMKKNG